jgi:hypothetical protein
MVALFHGFTHDASAHTSYLFIVKDLSPQSMAFRTSAQHKNPAASPFGATAWLRPFFRISLQCRSGLTIIIAGVFLRQQLFKKFPVTGSFQAKRRRIIERKTRVSTTGVKISEIRAGGKPALFA